MIQTIRLSPGAVLRCCRDDRFKKGTLSIQLLRPMCREEASLNALLVAVLLRGTEKHPDLRSITWKLDELYGAAVSTQVRRIGDIQTVGLGMDCIEDRFCLPGDRALEPAIRFLQELFLEPLTENGVFSREFVESEKKNLISAIEAQANDKRTYASLQMMKTMCRGDSFSVSRIGEAEDVAAITPEALWAHYREILASSPVEFFYVGSAAPEAVAELLKPMAELLGCGEKPRTRPLVPVSRPGEITEDAPVSQSKLSMGFVTPITQHHPDFAAMQVLNALYGAGMTSKLFLNVREKKSLCYYADSAYYGSKGILTVSSGVDADRAEEAKAEILRQLSLCAAGDITPEELENAKQAMLSGLSAIPDSPGAMEHFYAAAAISGLSTDLEACKARIRAVTAEDAARCAGSLSLHTVFLLRGVSR